MSEELKSRKAMEQLIRANYSKSKDPEKEL